VVAHGLSVKPTWKGQANVKLNAAVRMGRAAVRARMMGRACQGLGRRGYAHRSSTTDLERESKSAFLPKQNCNRQQTTTRTPAPHLIRNASAKRSRPGRGRPGVAPAGSVYGAVISGRFCVDQDLNIDLGPKSESGPGFDTDHSRPRDIARYFSVFDESWRRRDSRARALSPCRRVSA
jgi:hypothetical protein